MKYKQTKINDSPRYTPPPPSTAGPAYRPIGAGYWRRQPAAPARTELLAGQRLPG